MSKLKLSFLISAIFLVSACTTLPSREQMTKETEKFELPLPPKPGFSRVFVVRPSGVGGLIRFNIFLDKDSLDSSEMGWTRGSQHIYFYVKPGVHMLFSHAENTAELAIAPKEGESIFVEQNAEMGIIMARNSIHSIDSTTGTYHMMKTNKGEIKKTDL